MDVRVDFCYAVSVGGAPAAAVLIDEIMALLMQARNGEATATITDSLQS